MEGISKQYVSGFVDGCVKAGMPVKSAEAVVDHARGGMSKEAFLVPAAKLLFTLGLKAPWKTGKFLLTNRVTRGPTLLFGAGSVGGYLFNKSNDAYKKLNSGELDYVDALTPNQKRVFDRLDGSGYGRSVYDRGDVRDFTTF